MNEKIEPRKYFVKLKPLGNGLSLYLNKKILKHLRLCRDSDVCITLNKNRTITISKATYSDTIIEDIVANLSDLL